MKLFAFWKYDLFPYVLGGEVTRVTNDGSVETVEYGKGYLFRPVLIVPLEEGKEMLSKLNAARDNYGTARAALAKHYHNELKSKFPALKAYFH